MSGRRPDEILEYHRGGGRGLAGPLLLGGGLMLIGALLVIGAEIAHLAGPIRTSVSFAGVVACLAAPAVVLGGLFRRAVGEGCVTLRRDGVVFEQLGDTTFLPWDDVEDAREKDGKVEVLRKEGPPLVIDAGIPDPPAFAARIRELRRKADFNVL